MARAMSTLEPSTPSAHVLDQLGAPAAVPRSLFVRLVDESDLPPSTRHVLRVVAWSAGRDGTGSYLSVAAIAARTGLSVRQVQRALASARTLGWLRVSPRAGRTNDWILWAPSTVDNPRHPRHPGVTPTSGGGDTHVTRRKDLGRTQEGARESRHHLPDQRRASTSESDRTPTAVRSPGRRPARRAWCGECDDQTRLTQDAEGLNVRRCPRCHPLADRPADGLPAHRGGA